MASSRFIRKLWSWNSMIVRQRFCLSTLIALWRMVSSYRCVVGISFFFFLSLFAVLVLMFSTLKVSGELSNKGQPMRRFVQTFVLALQSAKKYYVRNDIFRYQDDVFFYEEDGADERVSVEAENEAVQPAQPAVCLCLNFRVSSVGLLTDLCS